MCVSVSVCVCVCVDGASISTCLRKVTVSAQRSDSVLQSHMTHIRLCVTSGPDVETS